ncbi:MAG: hypothetical protein HRT69_16950 [Flavobacteriaceae bacterium]|nr:hypothetical protein [Flavobacteriaceae bacterium]
MSLVQDYCVTCDKKGNYILDFSTTENASVVYSKNGDTNIITVNTNKKGVTTFNENFGNASKIFKYSFIQPGTTERRGQPAGEMGP